MTQRIFSTVPVDIGAKVDRAEIESVLRDELGIDPNSDIGKRVVDAEERKNEERRRYMSGPGELDLPEHLEAKRWRYFIPDKAFNTQPLFDRILVYQISTNEYQTASEHSPIVMTEKAKDNEQKRSPRGVIVGMGLLAADELRSNGTDLGDTVHIILSNPWHRPLERIGGKELYLVVLRSGDLVDNEDLRTRIRAGTVKVGVTKNAEGRIQHVLKDAGGELWYPTMPWITEDF